MAVPAKVLAIAAALLIWVAPAWPQDNQPGGTAAAAFSAEQVARGGLAYEAACATCHGADLHRNNPESPDLTGGPFRYGWQGKTVGERFTVIRDTMPKEAARTLEDQTYLDIVGYLLASNGVPTGEKTLVSNQPDLDRLVITIPPERPSSRRKR